ncbi:MAG: hypothetical protein J6C49_02645 [Elusimicrobiaceae bacterium]|nr:hypothetical protein [Elusimicrobiaceae bacterium]
MKKQHFFIFIAAALIAAGCTSPEQDQQIRLFWMQQYSNVMMKSLSKLPSSARQLPAVQDLQFREHRPAPRPAAQPQPQVIDVTIETDALPGKAPHAERIRMKRAWDAVQISNQKTLDDINAAFGGQVKSKAFIITTNTEKQLKQAAKDAANFAAYFAQQKELLTKQEQALNALMTQNRGSIKKLKKTNTQL